MLTTSLNLEYCGCLEHEGDARRAVEILTVFDNSRTPYMVFVWF
jgi:hypothetical protein